jgi:hypothetical protein
MYTGLMRGEILFGNLEIYAEHPVCLIITKLVELGK